MNEIFEANPHFTRRQMVRFTGLAGLTALTGISTDTFGQTQQTKPRVAVLASFWGATGSHADWIVNKLTDGYWWDGAYTPSRVEVASIYLHQHDTSGLGQKVAKAKNIPVYKTVAEATGRRIETPFMNMSYRPSRGAQFNKGARPPERPYIRGFDQ